MATGIIVPDGSQVYCEKCRKTMAQVNFYTYKDKSKCELCKSCVTMHINNWEPSTFLWLLEKFDVPYIPAEWNTLRDRAYQKDPYKMTGMSVFGKYLSKMKLKQWSSYTYADTDRLQVEAEEKAKMCGAVDITDEELAAMKEAYEKGEISEAQYKTFTEPVPVPQGYVTPYETDPGLPAGNGFDDPYPVNTNQFEKVELIDVSADLTQEDKVYLAMKWGRLYKADEWVSLEKLYNDFMESFDIQGAARIDTLKMICKTSLKMNQAIDCGDVESYQKLSRVYDAMMKSAKFTEAQRKEERNGDFDAIGQIVYFAEKEKGAIERYKTDKPIDIYDEAMLDLKRYYTDLIKNDSTLAQQIENFIKRKEIAEEQKRDQKKAKESGEDIVQISDGDYADFYESLEQDKKLDEGEDEE